MKKLLSILLTLVLICTLFGCNTSSGNVKIGIAAPDVTHGWVAGVAYYAEKYCKENNIQYKIITSSDAAEMSSCIDDLLAWGADAIITYPQWTGMETKIQEVIDDGTPVVSFDIDIAAEGIYKVTGDNYGMGYKSAQFIAERAASGSNIAILDVPSSGSVGSNRKTGFYDYMKSINFDTSNVTELSLSGFTKEEAMKAVSDYLATHENVSAIFSYDDETSIGAVQSIVEAGRTDIKAITGGGGMQEYFKMIDDETYESYGLSSALYSPSMITSALDVAIKICNGETVDNLITIETEIVSKENVKEYLDSENTIY